MVFLTENLYDLCGTNNFCEHHAGQSMLYAGVWTKQELISF